MKIKLLLILIFFITYNLTFAQITFRVKDFSNDYYGKVSIEDTSQVFSKGWVAIYDKKTNKQLIKVVSDELALSYDEDDKIAVNINENYNVAYGGIQSLIIYDDFNFDGIKDFAIEDGQNSCYHGPSYKVYLVTAKGLQYNSVFTALAQEYCGMFEVDHKEKKLRTSTKSGCCWHQFSEFIVENNEPKTVEIVEEDATFLPYIVQTTKTWHNGKMTKTSETTVDWGQEGIQKIFSFTLEKSRKKVVLFHYSDEPHYVLLSKDGTVEFSHSKDFRIEFDVNATYNAILFNNKGTQYKIYEYLKGTGKVGVEVTFGRKVYNLAGDINSKIGSLALFGLEEDRD